MNWNDLSTFASVARTGSFSKAADSLQVLQPAVSRRIAKLESQLGVHLMQRTRPSITLTEAGERLFAAVNEGEQLVTEAIASIRLRPADSPLKIDTSIGFASGFLLRHLDQFYAAHPDTQVEVISRDLNFSFQPEQADVIIVFDEGTELPGVEQQLIFHETMICVASPEYLANHPVPIDQLMQHELLMINHGSHIRDWQRILNKEELSLSDFSPKNRFTSYMVYRQAAINGQGLAVGWPELMHDALTSGQLVEIETLRKTTQRGYYACLTERARNYAPAKAFVSWLANSS